MALTQEQENVKGAFDAVGADIKLRHPVLKNPAAVTAYNGEFTELPTAQGDTYFYSSSSTLSPVGRFILSATGKGAGRWLLKTSTVNVQEFGAIGKETSDDSTAIQLAVDFGGSQSTAYTNSHFEGGNSPSGNNLLRCTVIFPYGRYRVTTPINLTNRNGIWLTGSGGRYMNSHIVGQTGSVILDFSGSSNSGAENLTFGCENGRTNASKIGCLFGLTKVAPNQATAGPQLGGLNCVLRNCTIAMGDFVGANGGFGSIGYLNIRSEEVVVENCTIQANSPVVLSNRVDFLSTTGNNFTASSSFAFLQDDAIGSMGVVKMTGMTLYGYERLKPAILHNGVNGLYFQGYIGRLGITPAVGGTYEAAIRICQYATNLTVNGTIESYSSLLDIQNELYISNINVAVANQVDPTRPVIIMQEGAKLSGLDVRVSIPNVSERSNRDLIYAAPVNGGNSATSCRIINSNFYCEDITDNRRFVTPNLRKQSVNSSFYSAFPVEKKGPYMRYLNGAEKNLGLKVSGNADIVSTLVKFDKADKTVTTSGNGGYYQARVKGTVRLGDANTTNGPCFAHFEGSITAILDASSATSNANANMPSMNILGKSAWNAGYMNIVNLSLSFDFSGPDALLVLRIITAGTANNEGANFVGDIELLSNYSVNQSTLFE